MRRRLLTLASALALAFSATAEFVYRSDMTVTGYSGATTLQNFPVLVRISPDRISGFDYLLCQADGKDIRFTSPDGKTVYPHEIDTWDPEGESLVWVNIPQLSGTETKFVFWFCDSLITEKPVAKDTWASANGGFYAGVWHLGEEATTETAMSVNNADSAKHDAAHSMNLTPLATKPDGGEEEKISVEGVVGAGRQNGLTTGSAVTGNGLRAGYRPTSFADFTKGQFTFSTWLKINDWKIWTVIAGVKVETARTGWWLQIRSKKLLTFYGDYVAPQVGVDATMSDDMTQDGWFHVTVTVNQTHVRFYRNGEFVAEGDVNAAPTADYSLFSLGQGPYRVAASYDEARILSTVASADWVKAEYETAAQEDFISYGDVRRAVGSGYLIVSAEPWELAGDAISPTYGKLTDLSSPIPLTAPETDVALADNLKVAFVGWDLYRMNDAGSWSLTDSGTGTTHEYVHEDGTNNKFVWRVVRKRPLTLSAVPEGSGSFEVDETPASAGTIWLAERETVSVKAVPNFGYDFLYWGGEHKGTVTPTLEIPFEDEDGASLEADFISNGAGHDPVTIGTSATPGAWADAASWIGGVLPQAGDTVLITNGMMTLDQPLPMLARIVISNATLTVSNWLTRVQAEAVVVGKGGVVRTVGGVLDGEEPNRVWMSGGTLTVEAGGTISADGAGYACNSGPAWAWVNEQIAAGVSGVAFESAASGTYGGAYSGQSVRCPPSSYGSAEEPSDLGSGCGELAQYTTDPAVKRTKGVAGGAVRLDFSGDVVIDGTVSASVLQDGTKGSGSMRGSGGSVWISCRTISGAGSVSADGGATNPLLTDNIGGGGRVAVHYDTSAQDAEGCDVIFSAHGGMASDLIGSTVVDPGVSPKYHDYPRSAEDHAFVASAGTIWFSDNRFLTSSNYQSKGLPFSGQWVSPVALPTLELDDGFTFSNMMLLFPTGTAVTVNGSLSVNGTGYYARRNCGLVFNSSDVHVKGNLLVCGARLEIRGGTLTVDGDVVESVAAQTHVSQAKSRYMGGELAIKALGEPDEGGYGAALTVGGTLTIPDRCLVCPFADPETGAFVKMCAGNVILASGGRIDASEKGWAMKTGPGAPATYQRGASHGGTGGSNVPTTAVPAAYGKEKCPLELGSGGGSSHTHAGFDGGGLVDLEVSGTFELNGLVTADGSTQMTAHYAGASSGGSVFIRAGRLTGTTGLIRAQGGCAPPAAKNVQAYGSTGGGGRIAVLADVNAWTDAMREDNVNVKPGCEDGALANTFGATAGTVFWGIWHKGLLLYIR